MAATLLLADDSVTIQRVIELTFADEDVTVVAVSDGDAAIARLEEQVPDIVLADVGMPGKTGYEVASYIKHSPRLSHIPVLLLTGAFEPVDQRRATEAGCDGVLAKPFEPQLVISRVRELLARAHGGGVAPEMVALPPVPPGRAEWEESPPSAPAPTDPAAKTASLGEYFDQLDEALAKLPSAHPQVAPVTGDWRDADDPQADEPTDTGGLAADDDTFDIAMPGAANLDARPSTGRLDVPSPTRATTPEAPLPAPRPEPSRPQPRPAPPTQAMPVLAEAFAALLAAEQPGAPPADTAAWASRPVDRPGDDLVERVAQRVLERLTDQVVRDTVTDLASSIAERMVREEIDRIKSAIK